jgi:acyl-CoA synthetase (NDP forming)
VERARGVIQGCLEAGNTRLGEIEGAEILKCYGFDILPAGLAATARQASEIAEKLGFPVVMKIVSRQILHKSDAGGVKLNLASKSEVEDAFREISASAAAYDPNAVIDGVLVQKMASGGEEIILGVKRYPIFGPLLMFGFGGIFVEIFRDVAFRLAPIGRNEARRMVRSIKSFKLLSGFRGRPRTDIPELERIMVKLSDMAVNHPEIVEMDVNPLLVHAEGHGATVADVRMILKSPDEQKGA